MEQHQTRFPNRKSPRMRHYDYSQAGYYFITICTRNKNCLFGAPEQLNRCGICAEQGFQEIERHFPGVRVDKFVVMPNHVHGIIALPGNGTSLSVVIGQYKGAGTRNVRRLHREMILWQTSFHDHVIRNQEDYLRIWNYIDTNPMRWQDDCFYAEPPPCSQ